MNKKLFICLILIIGVLIFFPNIIRAANILEDIAIAALKSVIVAFAAMLKIILNLILAIVGWIMDFVIDPNKFNVKQGAQIGWLIFRELANIFIVFSLLVIAFGFILDIEKFDAKKSFFFLIVIAFIVNYSFLFIGALYDVGNLFIKMILDNLGVVSLASSFNNFTRISVADFNQSWETENFVQDLLDAFSYSYATGSITFSDAKTIMTKAYEFFAKNKTAEDSLLSIATNAVLNIVLMFVYASGIASIMIALAIIFVMRASMFIFLIMLSPLAFALMILPWTRGQFDKWWGEVIRWTVFPFLSLFFVYTVLLVGNEMNCIAASGKFCGGLPAGNEVRITSPFVALQNIFFIVLMFLAFGFANDLSSFAVEKGKKIGAKLSEWPYNLLKKGGGMLLGGRLLGKSIQNARKTLERKFGPESLITEGFTRVTKPLTEYYEKRQRNLQGRFKAYIDYTDQGIKNRDERVQTNGVEGILKMLKKNEDNTEFIKAAEESLTQNKKVLKKVQEMSDPRNQNNIKNYEIFHNFRKRIAAIKGEISKDLYGIVTPFVDAGGEIITANWDYDKIKKYVIENKDILGRSMNYIQEELQKMGMPNVQVQGQNVIDQAVEKFIEAAAETFRSEDFVILRDDGIIEKIIEKLRSRITSPEEWKQLIKPAPNSPFAQKVKSLRLV